jgi:hypothetical protein
MLAMGAFAQLCVDVCNHHAPAAPRNARRTVAAAPAPRRLPAAPSTITGAASDHQMTRYHAFHPVRLLTVSTNV